MVFDFQATRTLVLLGVFYFQFQMFPQLARMSK